MESIITSQVSKIPENIKAFFRVLYTGSEEKGNDRAERYVDSSAEDAIFKTQMVN